MSSKGCSGRSLVWDYSVRSKFCCLLRGKTVVEAKVGD